MTPSATNLLTSRRERGIALVIVLIFVVLLTGLVVAYFSRTINALQLSNSSLSGAKADALARGAADIVVADLKQEIAAGSTPAYPSPSPASGTVYIPSTAANMLPRTSGTPTAGATPIPNLVRRSVRSDPIASPGVPSRASAVNSETDASLNGRKISGSRWNRHYLIQRSDTSTAINSAPVTSFVSPDWVVVTAERGPVVITSPFQSAGGETVTPIGRYAYAVYDEGGLLDVNVAGYPGDSIGSPASLGLTQLQASSKSTLALADIKQIFLLGKSNPTATEIANAAQYVNQIVGWRNYATGQAQGAFPSTTSAQFTFTVSGATQWLSSFVTANTTGYIKALPSFWNNRTDQMFLSRQQLLSIRSPIGFSQNALQYLCTFSRDINQPSAALNTNSPKVRNAANGGNDAGDASGTGAAEAAINPSFLTVRVTGAGGWKRNDGSTAVVGEPLVKERFALNRLAWIATGGPSASLMPPRAATIDPSVTQSITAMGGDPTNTNDPVYQFVLQGNEATVYSYFGLTWAQDNRANVGDGQYKWIYNHENMALVSAFTASNKPIRSLAGGTNVASQNREPDFFELLKAAVQVGSIGKAYIYTGSPDSTTPEGYAQQRDNSIDAAILQLGANIVDQFDYDSYPIRILFSDGLTFGGSFQQFFGIEDLPYLYAVREAKLMTKDSTPPQSALPQAGNVLVDPGAGYSLLQPEIWNPHAMLNANATSPRPNNFRVAAATLHPLTNTQRQFTVNVNWISDTGIDLYGQAAQLAPLSSSMTFSIPAGRLDLFREPTILAKPGVPTGSSLAGPATYILPASLFTASYQYGANGVTDDLKYTGMSITTSPLPMAFKFTDQTGGITIAPAGFVSFPTSGNQSYFPYVTYRLQYTLDGGVSWITYDEKYASMPSASSFDPPGNQPSNYNKTFYRIESQPWAQCAIGSGMAVACFDPRSSRFGMNIAGANGKFPNALNFPLTSAVGSWEDITSPWNCFGWAAAPATATNASMQAAAKQMAVMTTRPDEYQGAVFSYTMHGNNGYDTGPTAGGWTPSGSGAQIASGLFIQNNPSATGPSTRSAKDQQSPSGVPPQYFADPDGVVRRAMSAYVPTNGSIAPALAPASGLPSGLPLKPAYQFDAAGTATANPATNENQSRPIVLNRPFRSVAELSYVFSGTPWRNVDFSTPESGTVGLLDVFCVNPTVSTNGLTAGRVNLNTRQAPVLQAILAGAYKDEIDPVGSTVAPPLVSALSSSIAQALVNRTTSSASSQGPLTNVSELVGKWNGSVSAGSSIDGSKSYAGFTSDNVAIAPNNYDLSNTLTSDADKRIQRFREASIRALTAAGQTRVWNLMIDVVAQTGRYPANATKLENFVVEGEQRYWVHVAIDRFTGAVLDRQIEVVKE